MTELRPTHRRRHYGRRKGPKLRARQAGLLRDLLPQLSLVPQPGLDPRAYFTQSSWPGSTRPSITPAAAGVSNSLAHVRAPDGWPPRGAAMASEMKEVWLEVGFGAGEHLVWQAENNPDAGIIGAEPYISGIAKLLAKIAAPSVSLRSTPPPRGEDKKVSSSPAGGGPAEGRGGGGFNIRIYEGDARDVITALPDAGLSRVFILFPDPWPKTRHHKRRFIQMEMLDELARVMRPGAELRFATDDRGYLIWALERFMAHSKFIWTAEASSGWRTRPPDWPETRYEAKAVKAGKPCIYLSFRRL